MFGNSFLLGLFFGCIIGPIVWTGVQWVKNRISE